MAARLRPLERNDVGEVARLVAATPLWQRYGLTEEKAAAALVEGLDRGDALRVADEAGRPVGFFWVLARGMFGRSPYLKWIGVAPGSTGGGLGQLLLRGAEAAAAAVKPELFLLCSDFNGGARRFYEREGYRQVGELPAYVLPDVNEVLYFKRLA
jgi:GNAT superfamily N-acetyltransferase